MGDLIIYPEKGNVAFGSGKECWAFTLTRFARFYAKKFKIDEAKMMEKLWGDNYFDAAAKKWKVEPIGDDGQPIKRAFNNFIMEPVIKLTRAIMDGNYDQMNKMLGSLEITLSSEEKELKGKALLKLVMSRWISAADTLIEMMIVHLPSPKVA